MSLYDLQITGPVLHAQENVDQHTTRISRLSDQLADLQLDLAREVRALRADREELRAAITPLSLSRIPESFSDR